MGTKLTPTQDVPGRERMAVGGLWGAGPLLPLVWMRLTWVASTCEHSPERHADARCSLLCNSAAVNLPEPNTAVLTFNSPSCSQNIP